MNEKFSMNVMNDYLISNDLVQNYSIEISIDEFDNCCKYLHALVDRVGYNYSDAFVTLPIHSIISDVFFQVLFLNNPFFQNYKYIYIIIKSYITGFQVLFLYVIYNNQIIYNRLSGTFSQQSFLPKL
jgi:hypothetical protein